MASLYKSLVIAILNNVMSDIAISLMHVHMS